MKLFTYLSFLICLIFISIIIYTKGNEKQNLNSSKVCEKPSILENEKENILDNLIIQQCNKNTN